MSQALPFPFDDPDELGLERIPTWHDDNFGECGSLVSPFFDDIGLLGSASFVPTAVPEEPLYPLDSFPLLNPFDSVEAEVVQPRPEKRFAFAIPDDTKEQIDTPITEGPPRKRARTGHAPATPVVSRSLDNAGHSCAGDHAGHGCAGSCAGDHAGAPVGSTLKLKKKRLPDPKIKLPPKAKNKRQRKRYIRYAKCPFCNHQFKNSGKKCFHPNLQKAVLAHVFRKHFVQRGNEKAQTDPRWARLMDALQAGVVDDPGVGKHRPITVGVKNLNMSYSSLCPVQDASTRHVLHTESLRCVLAIIRNVPIEEDDAALAAISDWKLFDPDALLEDMIKVVTAFGKHEKTSEKQRKKFAARKANMEKPFGTWPGLTAYLAQQSAPRAQHNSASLS